MKNAILVLLFALSLPLFSHAQRESGGWGFAQSLYNCVEENPQNKSNPKLAFVTLYTSCGGAQVIVRPSEGSFGDPKHNDTIYSGLMQVNSQVRCALPCEVFVDSKTGGSFGVTRFGNAYQGIFTINGLMLKFKCEVGIPEPNFRDKCNMMKSKI